MIGIGYRLSFRVSFRRAEYPERATRAAEPDARRPRAVSARDRGRELPIPPLAEKKPQPKPAFDAVMPLSAIRAKVGDELRKSKALEVYWKRPVTGAQKVVARSTARSAAGW